MVSLEYIQLPEFLFFVTFLILISGEYFDNIILSSLFIISYICVEKWFPNDNRDDNDNKKVVITQLIFIFNSFNFIVTTTYFFIRKLFKTQYYYNQMLIMFQSLILILYILFFEKEKFSKENLKNKIVAYVLLSLVFISLIVYLNMKYNTFNGLVFHECMKQNNENITFYNQKDN